jgi:predicted DNA-binding protein
MIRELEQSQPHEIERAEIVKSAHSDSPVSIRLSAPLLEALDRLSKKQHRNRSNLIQHILWQYVHEDH